MLTVEQLRKQQENMPYFDTFYEEKTKAGKFIREHKISEFNPENINAALANNGYAYIFKFLYLYPGTLGQKFFAYNPKFGKVIFNYFDFDLNNFYCLDIKYTDKKILKLEDKYRFFKYSHYPI